MRPRYLLCPGTVISIYDWEEHYISAAQLTRLYRVNPRECVVQGSPGLRDTEDLIHLTPSVRGVYELLPSCR